MTDATVVEIALAALWLGAKLAAPVLVASLVVGFVVSLFQSVTQMQDPSLAFVPKLVAVGICLLVFGSWMITEATLFTEELYGRIPDLVRGG
ncbi:flagellar biosynthetic protein FliQ [Aquipuribacter nitratireducens]|uniref:Flagellar biosynthetic protein FliQ n=1 Tax=Aquipuribacter nitratireducens TaxID=650104 RepID=A0ABW0GNM5_9MICO